MPQRANGWVSVKEGRWKVPSRAARCAFNTAKTQK